MNNSTYFIRNFTTKVSKFPMEVKSVGRYQNWRSPVYVSPHISPLQKGPDYSFQDGRQLMFTSKIELDRKFDQVRLAKTIVQYLSEIKEMETMYEQNVADKRIAEERFMKWTPKEKSTETIY